MCLAIQSLAGSGKGATFVGFVRLLIPGDTCFEMNTATLHTLVATSRSEGFPNGIFHPCALWDRALARWESCRRAAVVVVAVVSVIWKMSKYKEMHTFSKMGMSEISRNVNLSEIKAPAGAS